MAGAVEKVLSAVEKVTEVLFEPKKHGRIHKGSLVGEEDRIGYIVYCMPPVGAFDPTTDKVILKGMEEENIGLPEGEARVDSSKSERKALDKSRRWGIYA